MGKRIYPLNVIMYWYCYDIDDICTLYKPYKLHPQTVRGWIANGLPTVDSGSPTLIYGHALKEHLGKLNQSHKHTVAFEQMFCLGCKEGRAPFKKQIRLESMQGYLMAKAVCVRCKGKMNKSYKLEDMGRLRSLLRVVDVLELYDSESSPLNTHFAAHDGTQSIEPAQGELL